MNSPLVGLNNEAIARTSGVGARSKRAARTKRKPRRFIRPELPEGARTLVGVDVGPGSLAVPDSRYQDVNKCLAAGRNLPRNGNMSSNPNRRWR
jgi:hypothetical protein